MLPIFACLMMCGDQVALSVDAKAGSQASAGARFAIAAGDPHVTPRNPDFIVISKAVARALEADGFQPADAANPATVVMVIDWMTGDPKVRYRHIGGDVGGPQVQGAAPGKPGMPVGGTNNAGSFGFGAEPTDAENLAYPQTFTLKAMDAAAFKADPAAPGLWSLTVKTETHDESPAAAAPLLIAAALPYMGQTAHRPRVVLGTKEDLVKYVRGEIANPPAKPQ